VASLFTILQMRMRAWNCVWKEWCGPVGVLEGTIQAAKSVWSEQMDDQKNDRNEGAKQ
jgi:hypothetical protein